MNARTLTPLVLFLFLLLARAEEWPEFRGPGGQGLSKARGVPVHWSPSSNMVWKASIPGAGWSSPVVFKKQVFLTTAVSGENGLSLQGIALDAATGRQLWAREVFKLDKAGYIHRKNSHASPTPLVEKGRVYVHFGPNGTACLRASDGVIIWKNEELKYSPVHGSGGSPISAGELLVFGCDGATDPFLVALKKSDGTVAWRTPRQLGFAKNFSFSTALLIEVKGKKQIISPASGGVCAYDPATGVEIWRVRYDGYSVVPRPVFAHGLLFVSSAFDRPVVMAIRPDGKGDVTETHVAWKLSKGAPNTPSMLVSDDELYMVSDGGIASCVDAKSGTVHWQERLGGDHSASPVLLENRIYFQSEQGTGYVVKAGTVFEKLAENPMEERTLASLAPLSGGFLLRTAEHLYRIGTPSRRR